MGPIWLLTVKGFPSLKERDMGTFIHHLPLSRLVSCKSNVSPGAHLHGSIPGVASALLELQVQRTDVN